MKRSFTFTLIELLVVIAIIAILAAMSPVSPQQAPRNKSPVPFPAYRARQPVTRSHHVHQRQ